MQSKVGTELFLDATEKSSWPLFPLLTHCPLKDQELLQVDIQDHSGSLGFISPTSYSYLLSSLDPLIQV